MSIRHSSGDKLYQQLSESVVKSLAKPLTDLAAAEPGVRDRVRSNAVWISPF